MNPNDMQAVEDEEIGIDEVQDDIDYDALYGGEEVSGTDTPKSKELQNSYSEILKDVAKQGVKEVLIGAGGAYGDLFELAGINSKDFPGQKAKNKAESDILEKMQQPGYKPSFSDIYLVSGDEDISPQAFGFPTSEDLRSANELVGGPGEAKTPQGKYAARAGKLYGGGLAFGQVNPAPAIVGGIAGQAVEDLGGGPLAQAAAEIVAMISTPGGGAKKLLASNKKDVQKKITDLRNLGYNEDDITLAINSAYKDSRRTKIASKGQKTEDAFKDFAEHSNEIVDNILTSNIPGIEKGIENVHQLASDAYGAVSQEAKNITITNSRPFLNASKNVVDKLQNTLGNNPEAAPFIRRISEAAMDATQYPSAEKMMNFYKELNSMGNWLGRSQKDKLITELKEGIKDTFRSEGKAGKKLADDFENVNAGIRKAYQAEEAMDLIQKVSTQDGIDYKRFRKLFDKQDNVKVLDEVLGKSQTNNLKMISNVGAQVKDFDKSWKAANAFRIGPLSDTIRGAAASYYIYKGDWEGLAKVAATKLGTVAMKKLAEHSLRDPKFQNLVIKGLHAIKVESPRLMKSADEALKKYLMEEGIDLDQI